MNIVRISFQAMVAAGFFIAAVGIVFLANWLRRRRLPESRLFYWAVIASAPLSLVALYAGWIVTEVGRQPWVVYRVMQTRAAVTGASGIPVGYATLALVYAGLLIAAIWLLRRLAAAPLEVAEGPPGQRREAAHAAR